MIRSKISNFKLVYRLNVCLHHSNFILQKPVKRLSSYPLISTSTCTSC